MPGRDYAVDLRQGDMYLGAGFLLTRCYVLTADHCLRRLTDHDDRVSVCFESGATLEGCVRRRVADADLAIVEILHPQDVPFTLPNADHARRGDRWRGLHRPLLSDPDLGGLVDAYAVKYHCEGGDFIEAIQLAVEQTLGDYSGYSGGPVEKATPGSDGAVIGILIEQYPDRQDARRSANVLFAATIHEALSRFEYFSTGHLHRVLKDPSTAPPGTSAQGVDSDPDAVMDRTETVLVRLKEWSDRGLLDPAQVVSLAMQAGRAMIDGTLGGEDTGERRNAR
ncbi:trypsin-like peptidase domain-containing protein [Streptomyces sp. NPDC005538]|uniref:trypsin-like peptidase domain-containing protein n=1 Tax=unclassified Streptomyces TaxID=2593676 RepID=UPI0033B5BCDA